MDNDNNVKQNNRPSRAGSANPFFFTQAHRTVQSPHAGSGSETQFPVQEVERFK